MRTRQKVQEAMPIGISGLRGRDRLRIEVVKRVRRLLERRGASARAVRVAFFDDDGPRGGGDSLRSDADTIART